MARSRERRVAMNWRAMAIARSRHLSVDPQIRGGQRISCCVWHRRADHEASVRCLVVGVDWIGGADVSPGATDPRAQSIEKPRFAGVARDQMDGVHRSSLTDAIDPPDSLL